ncbi:MAG: hypothetical protein ACI9QL_000290 [Candidatus Omnitrophota bacterium]|jgi:hypothetical protein
MKKIISTFSISLLVSAGAFADIDWSGNANAILGPDNPDNQLETGFNTPLTGNAFNSGAGYFVQLLNAGSDGINAIPAIIGSAAELTGSNGAFGDDMVVATRWIGAGRFVDTNGKWDSGNPYGSGFEEAGNYFVRTWVGISPDGGSVSTGAADAALPPARINGPVEFWWYGESAVVSNPGDGQGAPALNTLDFTTTPFVANQQVSTIPEPSSLALMVMGGAMAFFRIRRKK